MIETTKMSTRGQVIIPKEIRTFIDAKEKTLFAVTTLDKNTILMKKMDKEKLMNEFKEIRASVKNKLTEQEIANEIKTSRKSKSGN